jgi:enolase
VVVQQCGWAKAKGGKHAADSTDMQEFMILPVAAPSFNDLTPVRTDGLAGAGTTFI